MSQLTITPHTATIHYFSEDLGGGITMAMVLIPEGSFLMGSPADELERNSDEGPQHEVHVSLFFMGRTPVTQAQWRRVAQMPKVEIDLNPDPSNFQGDNRPVEQVSWLDAMEFCQRLSRATGRQYALPSEAQWEYACRAGTTTPFHFGETISTDLANYCGTNEEYGAYGRGEKGEYRRATTDVTTFSPNQFGLYDMHGNVLEWCMDDWHGNYEGAPDDGTAWVKNAESQSRKVLRGGSWDPAPGNCRSAYRYYYSPDSRLNNIGFRVSCASPRPLA